MRQVTELLKDQGIGIINLDAQTRAVDGEIWFRLEVILELTAGVRACEQWLRPWVCLDLACPARRARRRRHAAPARTASAAVRWLWHGAPAS